MWKIGLQWTRSKPLGILSVYEKHVGPMPKALLIYSWFLIQPNPGSDRSALTQPESSPSGLSSTMCQSLVSCPPPASLCARPVQICFTVFTKTKVSSASVFSKLGGLLSLLFGFYWCYCAFSFTATWTKHTGEMDRFSAWTKRGAVLNDIQPYFKTWWFAKHSNSIFFGK